VINQDPSHLQTSRTWTVVLVSLLLLSFFSPQNMTSSTPIKMPEHWSKLLDESPEDIDDIIGLSLVPEDAVDTLKEHVSTPEEFAAIDKESAVLIVDDLASRHPKALTSKIKKHLLVSNLLSLVNFKNAGGCAATRPTPAEIKHFVTSGREQVSFQDRLCGPSPPPDHSSMDSKLVNGAKLALAIPPYNGKDGKKWFDWKDTVYTKIGQFPAFGAVFEDEGEAKKEKALSSILYNIFKEKTRGGSAQTLVDSLANDEKTGYHAFQALVQAMEGSEVADRLRKEADRLKKEAKKDSKTMVLEWQGNILKYFDVLDKIEALDKRRPISEEKKMGMLLDSVIDAEYRQSVIQLRREIKNKSLTLCKELFLEIRTVETHLETGETEEPMKPPVSVLR
jgi:hypothetical protein